MVQDREYLEKVLKEMNVDIAGPFSKEVAKDLAVKLQKDFPCKNASSIETIIEDEEGDLEET